MEISNSEIQVSNGETFISLYKGELTGPVIARQMARIKGSFPALPIEFYSIIGERLKVLGFSDERLIDAVNHVIDNCIYPTPTIANFVNFDKKIRLYTYQEMMVKASEYGAGVWQQYEKKKINEITFWFSKADAATP